MLCIHAYINNFSAFSSSNSRTATQCFFYTISDSNDYIGVSTVFTFSESSEQCENVTIIDDDIPESCESFSVDVSTDTESAVFSESSRTVTILDNEGCYTIRDTHH